MAYTDIEQWRTILESEDAEKKAYDEACERRAKEKADLDEKDFWECDQAEIDPRTMGIGEEDLEEKDELSDVEDVDEEIDFSKYGIEEADEREPLYKASDLLGMPASTANLTGQDSVQLAEAINRLAEALAAKKADEKIEEKAEEKIDEAAATDAGWLAWAGGDEAVKGWDEATRKKSRELFDDLVKRGKIDGATGDVTPEAVLADIQKMKADYKAATGVDLPAGEEEQAKAEAESKKALEAAKKFYDRWLDDPDFREKNALKDKDGATLTKAANPENPNGKGKVVAGTDPESQGAKLFKSYFDQMTPEDQEEFDAYARKRSERFTTKHYAPHKIDSLNKKGSLHGADGDDDEGTNPLAQHGLDQTFNADNADDDVMDDPESGDEFYSQFDPEYQTISHEGVAKHIMDVAAAFGKKQGMTPEQVFDLIYRTDRMRKIANSVKKAGQDDRQLTDKELEYVFDTMPAEDLEAFKDELKAEAKDEKEKTFVDYLFRFGKEREVNLKDMLKEYGVAADQSGDTGAGTQQGDTLIYVIICALAYFYGVAQDDADELWRVKASQAPTKKDKELGVEPRKYSRHLACKILQELFDELHDYQMKDAPAVKVTQSPADGPKIQKKDWEKVQKQLAGLLLAIELRADKSERKGAWNEIKNYVEKYNGSAGNKGEREARKLKTYLTPELNDEYQALLAQVRNGFDQMTTDAKIRLIELDRMRLGDSLTMAQAKAQKAYETAAKKNPQAFDNVVKAVAKSFLAGGSNNVSRDGITFGGQADA